MTAAASSFPEYRDEGLTRDSREHLLGALDYGKQAHDDLLRADRRSALIKIDYLIALAREARKPLLDVVAPKPVHPQEKEFPLEEKPRQCELGGGAEGCEACQ